MPLLKGKFKPLQKTLLFLLAFVVAVVPLIVFLRQVELSETLKMYWVDEVNNDFFSYYKMFYLLLVSLALLVFFVPYTLRNGIIKTYYYLPLAIFGIFALFSSVLSEYPRVALWGFPDRYEGLLVILAYLFLTVVTINVNREKEAVNFVIGALLISALFLGVHGIFQYAGLDFFQSDLGRELIVPSEFRHIAQKIDFRVPGGRIYSTMFNPNYVGSYGAMLVILLLGFFIQSKDRKNIFILGALNVLMFAYLLGSKSRAGMVGLIFGLILLGFLLRHQIKDRWRPLAVLMLVFCFVFLGMQAFSLPDFARELIMPGTLNDEGEKEMGASRLVDIKSQENHLKIITEKLEINAIWENNNLSLYDVYGDRLSYSRSLSVGQTDFNLKEEEYSDHSFTLYPQESFLVWNYNNRRAIFKLVDGEFFIVGFNEQLFELKDVPSWGFAGRERLGSSRGYIWSRSLPLLTDTLLLGYGADTYAMHFPQEDIVGKLKFLGSTHRIVDKPHNIYLQTAINTGIPSLLALLALWGGYLLHSLKLFWNNDLQRWEAQTGVAIAAAVAAYCTTGLFNDSVVAVAPVFWVLLGIGISMNLKMTDTKESKKKSKKKKKGKKRKGA